MERKDLIQKGIGVLIILISIFFIIPWKYNAFILGTIVDAVCKNIIMISDKSSQLSKHCGYQVNYTVDNKQYVKVIDERSKIFSMERNKGDKIELFYDPNNPSDSIDNKTTRYIIGFIFLIIGIGVVIF